MNAEPVFSPTDLPPAHRARRKEILRRHPEAAALQGAFRWTAPILVGMVAAQYAIGILAREAPLWLILVLAYTVGATLSHALYVMIHEATHDLVLRGKASNKIMGIVANLPTVLPSAISFRKYHLLHHAHLGAVDMDPDVPYAWEARIVGNSWWRKALWLSLFWVSQALRPLRIRSVRFWDFWTITNLVVVVAADAAIFYFFGGPALLYLAVSTFFALGLHPLGGRWIQEHFVTKPGQETYSYYGGANLIAFNMGYHNEHHDLMNIPWSRLPALKRLAPEFYEPLASYRSWTGVVLRFIFDPKLSPNSRITRPAVERPAQT